MQFRRSVLWATLLAAGPAATRADPPAARPDPAAEEKEAALAEGATVSWNNGLYGLAAHNFNKLLKQFPDSPNAGEYAYKLAALHLLQDRAPEAAALFEKLVRDHPDTSWAVLVARSHLTDQQLIKLGDEFRLKAAADKSDRDARRAVGLFRALLARFPTTQGNPEILYKAADSLRRAGNAPEAHNVLRVVADRDKDGDWGKTARALLAGPDALPARADELVKLSAA